MWAMRRDWKQQHNAVWTVFVERLYTRNYDVEKVPFGNCLEVAFYMWVRTIGFNQDISRFFPPPVTA